ncbi:hypothetical protein JQ575_39120 [Bradyrhizobium sp. JYMT SZCCT0428]|nr:hypothetical protein [Bradyrhizobium sp. JYMT SZCCT0428]
MQAESKPTFLRRSSSYVVGVDLGQSTDPTAIAVIEWQKGVIDLGSEFERHTGLSGHLQKSAEFADVRHLERLPLGMSYPSVVQHVANLLARPPVAGAELIIDETGVGRAVGDIFVEAGMKPKRVTITAGTEATPAKGFHRFHVAKTVLISNLDAMLHTGTVRFAADLSEAGAMAEELKDFRRKVSDAGRASYAARTGRHDDLVLAVAIGCWWVSRPPPPKVGWGTYGHF